MLLSSPFRNPKSYHHSRTVSVEILFQEGSDVITIHVFEFIRAVVGRDDGGVEHPVTLPDYLVQKTPAKLDLLDGFL